MRNNSRTWNLTCNSWDQFICSIIKSSKRTFSQLIHSNLVNTAINIFAHIERSIGFSRIQMQKRMKRFVKGKFRAQMRSWTANPIAEMEGLFAEYLSIYSLNSLYVMEGAICFKTCTTSKFVSSTILGCPFAGLGSKLPDWRNEVQIFFTSWPCSDLKPTVLSIGNFLGYNQWKNPHQLTELNPAPFPIGLPCVIVLPTFFIFAYVCTKLFSNSVTHFILFFGKGFLLRYLVRLALSLQLGSFFVHLSY